MNAVRLWQDVVLAAALAGIGALALHGFAPWLGQATTLRAIVFAVVAVWLGWTLARERVRSGRMLAMTAWIATAAALVVMKAPLALWLFAGAVAIWLLRSLARHRRLAPALIDAGWSLLALAAAVATARHTGGLGLALWSFFLMQACTAFFPTVARNPEAAAVDDDDRFAQARRCAEAALARLSRTVP